MSKVRIETTQHVFFDYEVAQVSDRIFATVIDLIILGVYEYFTILIINSAYQYSNTTDTVLYWILQIPIAFYHPMMEFFAQGQSLGKMTLKLRVLQFDGALPKISSVVIRWMFRIVDFQLLFFIVIITTGTSYIFLVILSFILSPMIAIVFISKNNNGQRIGDFLANTTVVKDKQRASLDDTVYRTINDRYVPTYQNVLKLSDRDLRIIQDTLDNYRKTENDQYVKELAKKAANLLEITGSLKAVTFLETIIKDYNYLATQEDISA